MLARPGARRIWRPSKAAARSAAKRGPTPTTVTIPSVGFLYLNFNKFRVEWSGSVRKVSSESMPTSEKGGKREKMTYNDSNEPDEGYDSLGGNREGGYVRYSINRVGVSRQSDRESGPE